MRNLVITILLFFFFLQISSAQIISDKSEVRRVSWIKKGLPEIKIFSPDEATLNTRGGYILTGENTIQIEGTVAGTVAGTEITSFEVNGEKHLLSSSQDFAFDFPLTLGSNLVNITAKDGQGNQSDYDLFINRIKKENRIALVIGNATYAKKSFLKNTINDANSMSQSLEKLNFRVFTYTNLDFNGMRIALRDFSDEIDEADVVWIYFAGHGVQVNNINYLIPIDAELKRKSDVPLETISVDQIMNTLEMNGADGLNIIILDACRNNPFIEWGTRGVEDGLAPVAVPTGSLIAFSTSPNSYASDGEGENGLYTGELIKQMEKPQRIEDVFINTRLSVEKLSRKNQSPWELARLRGEFYLKTRSEDK